MSDAGFFRGTSAEQDNRFSDKEKKLLKQMKFGDSLSRKVDMSKVKLEVIKPWIAQKITSLLGIEDDVVVEFVFNQLELKSSSRRGTIRSLEPLLRRDVAGGIKNSLSSRSRYFQSKVPFVEPSIETEMREVQC